MARRLAAVRKRWRVATAAALALSLMLGGCRVKHASDNHARQQILYTSTLSDPRTFNPILITDSGSGEAIGNVFEGLVDMNVKTTLPQPRLALKWDLAPDQKTVTFHLRHGIKWFDGAPFTAHDVVFTMRVIYDKKIPNSMRPILTIDGKEIEVEAPDDNTVVMRLPRPFAPLMNSIGLPIIPAHILEPTYRDGKFNQAWTISTRPEDLIGLGQFKMTRYVQSQMLQYVRNPDFWMSDQSGAPIPRLSGETTLIVQDQNANYLKFLSGQLDIYTPRPEEVQDLRERAEELKINLVENGVDTGELFFCFNRNPRHYVKSGQIDPKLNWFTDLNFLRAIAHAIDKQGMINLAFHGLAAPAVAEISPANKIFHNPNLKDYDYNLQESAQLLEAAGYHLIRPGVRADAQGNPLVFSLATNTGVTYRDQMCAILKQDLSTLGIQVNYRPLDFVTLVEKLDSNFDWDCMLMGFTGGVEPNGGANFLRSSGGLHLWNPAQQTPATPWEAEIDKLVDQGTMEMDPYQRAPCYWRIQQILHDQLPIIETVRSIRYTAYRKSLLNYEPTVWGLYQPEYIQFKQD